MVNNLKEIVSDILYVSKITKTQNKELLLFFSFLDTAIAFSDIACYYFFLPIFSDLSVLPETIQFLNYLFEIDILLPAFRYYIQYFRV